MPTQASLERAERKLGPLRRNTPELRHCVLLWRLCLEHPLWGAGAYGTLKSEELNYE